MTKDLSPEQVLKLFIQDPRLEKAADLVQLQSLKTCLLKIAGTAIIKVRYPYFCVAPRFTLNLPSNMRDSQTSFIQKSLGLLVYSHNRLQTARPIKDHHLPFPFPAIASLRLLLIMGFQDITRSNVPKEKTEVIMAIAYLRGLIATLIITLHHQTSTIMGVGLVSG